VYLAPLEEIAATGRTLADRWLERYDTAWGGDVSRIFAEGAL
jgi:glutamate--cysteine ligase